MRRDLLTIRLSIVIALGVGCGSDSTTASRSGSSGGADTSADGRPTSGTDGGCSESDLAPPFCHRLVRVEHTGTRPTVLLPIPNRDQSTLLVWADDEARLVRATDFSEVLGASANVTTGPSLRVFVGDFDGDGIPDVGQADAGAPQPIRLYSGVDLHEIAVSEPAAVPRKAAPLDVDGDGRDEVVAVAGRDLQVLALDGNDLVIQTEYPDVVMPCPPDRIVRGDFNGDTVEDLAIPTSALACPESGAVTEDSFLVKFVDPEDPSTVENPPASPQPNSAYDAAVGDLDGDGLDDLVLQDGEKVTLLRWNENRFFVMASRPWDSLGAGSTRPIPLVGDVDGDGRAEIILGGFGGDTFSEKDAYLYWGGSLDSEPYVFPSHDRPVHLSDLNGDGVAEIIMLLSDSEASSTAIYWSI